MAEIKNTLKEKLKGLKKAVEKILKPEANNRNWYCNPTGTKKVFEGYHLYIFHTYTKEYQKRRSPLSKGLPHLYTIPVIKTKMAKEFSAPSWSWQQQG